MSDSFVPIGRAARAALACAAAGIVATALAGCSPDGKIDPASARSPLWVEPRNEVTYLRGPYNFAQFRNENGAYQSSAAWHYHHGKEHDVLQKSGVADHDQVDAEFDRDVVAYVENKSAKIEPTMELYGPYTAQFAWRVYRAIDWTHMHHEQTYDIMSYDGISWEKKKEWTDRAVRYYLDRNAGVARSVAPLDITMRRAAVMMKPYFSYYRNYYPKSNDLAWVAHWWHPSIYEAYMIAGPDKGEQQRIVAEVDGLQQQVMADRPHRMLLSREIMPRYSRMSPESANIFDNLHMLHGIVYDILAYPKWTESEKRAELYRFIDAMNYQPGDEKYARKFATPHPDTDPRVYEPWMTSAQGEMSRIMMEMHEEMMPLMTPDGATMKPELKQKMAEIMRMKMTDGMEPGEPEGSLHDAMMTVMPDMKMDPESMKPGATPLMMRDAMLKGWQQKYGDMPDVEPLDMSSPPPPPGPATRPTATASR